MRQIAAERGGKFLSPHYQYAPAKLHWRCAQGHEWWAVGTHVKAGSWCHVCARHRPKWTIEKMRAVAKARGGRCLSEEYVPKPAGMQWQCAKGHVWWKDGVAIANKTWCPRCSDEARRFTLVELKRIAAGRGGRLLSTRHDPRRRLRWRCAKKHEWLAMAAPVKSGNWCATCAGRPPLAIDDMRRLARERGGRCVSTRYVPTPAKLRWRCAKGHEWRASVASVRGAGAWCPRCSGKARLTVEELDRLARSRGGRLLSRRLTNGYTPLLWRCVNGHRWRARAFNVKNSGTWCRVCAIASRSRH